LATATLLASCTDAATGRPADTERNSNTHLEMGGATCPFSRRPARAVDTIGFLFRK
jgi:hypothetical protein